MKVDSLEPRFVEFIPQEPEEGLLYISIEYSTTAHLCACGCSIKVVLPLSPAEWQLYFDGESISLTPSVGNWELRCRSHYLIRRNEIRRAGPWSQARVEAGRRRDLSDLDAHFDRTETAKLLAASGDPRPKRIGAWWSLFRRRAKEPKD